MKAVLKGLSLSILLLVASLMTVQSFAEVCGVVTINSGSLNIRSNANQASKVISRAAKDSALSILDSHGAWYKVKLNNGKVGYGSMSYINELTPNSSENCGTVQTSQTSLNIRRSANSTSRVISKATKGSALRILVWGSWYKVKLNNGKVGYAHSDYVITTNNESSQTYSHEIVTGSDHNKTFNGLSEPAMITIGAGVSIRTAPKITAKRLDILDIGTIVQQLDKTKYPHTIGTTKDYWYKIKRQTGQEGWIFGSLLVPVKLDELESAYIKLAQARLNIKKPNFADSVNLHSFLARIESESNNREARAIFSLLKYLTLRLCLSLVPPDTQAQPYKRWIDSQNNLLFHIPVGDGGWILKSEILWQLHKQYSDSMIADEIAWQAAENNFFSDCEGYLPCYLNVVNQTTSQYLQLYPNGKHSEEAALFIADYLRGVVSNKNQFFEFGTNDLLHEVQQLKIVLSHFNGDRMEEARSNLAILKNLAIHGNQTSTQATNWKLPSLAEIADNKENIEAIVNVLKFGAKSFLKKRGRRKR